MVIGRRTLSAPDRDRIHAAVAAAERRTRARFAIAIVPVSDRYALYPVVWGALAALSAGGILALLRLPLALGAGFAIEAAVFVVLTLLLGWLPLRLLIVPPRIKRAHARQLAHREFAARILAASPHRDGVLFFVSLSERYVEIIADRDIHARVAEGTWDRLVADFIATIKAGRLADGIIAAVDSCGALLEQHCPPEQTPTR